MIGAFLKLFVGHPYKKFLNRARPLIGRINALEAEYQQLTDAELQGKTQEFKERFKKGESLDQLLPEAFAVVKNAARRLCGRPVSVCEHELIWNMVHYDVQLIGGIALHQGKIAEMATGEGKTLVATLPLYLNALTGRNCQLITVNDYLVRRDAEWMGHLYNFLGLTVGCIQNTMSPAERQAAYAADITYGTSSEFGFDYLRDNGMATRKNDQVQRDHYYCIVDEVDSILIDEARTPLIISGPAHIEREAPFALLKPGVERLVNLQQRLCNRLVGEAREVLEKTLEGNDAEEALKKLLQVKLGMPKNRILLRLMENGAIRKKLDRFELEMNSDFQKEELYALKEALYFAIEEKQHQADLTELGRQALHPDNPDAFVLIDLPTLFMELDKRTDLSPEERQAQKREAEQRFETASEEIHCLSQLLRAYCLYERDIAYVVQDNRVMIVDENTGRVLPGRRWSEGLHQAIEAKEGAIIQEETRTYATITIQNYFRLYDKISGMTGTAETEANEFYDIYKLEVMPIPTHRACIRKDLDDIIYKTRREKYNAVIQKIKEAHGRGQPVLVGTTSVEASEVFSKMLRRENIPHNVLNAKHHAQESDIVADAGQKGAVTIATNMAGRGTDIKLGESVAELGGLFVLGTERHESRRIDRQLRGRCSRQGDPGLSGFYISLEDDLMRLFANAGPIGRILESSFEEGEALAHPLLNRSIQSAQKRVEEQNYAIRKRLLKYDDVLNRQREVIYGMRNEAIASDHPRDLLFEMITEELETRVQAIVADNHVPETNALEALIGWVNIHFPVNIKLEDLQTLTGGQLSSIIVQKIQQAYAARENLENPAIFREIERYTLIRPIDRHWQDHLTEMDELRRSVSLRSYGQRDPLNEYKSEAFTFFQEMMGRIRQDICIGLFRMVGNLGAFQHMFAQMAPRVQQTGPEDATPALTIVPEPQVSQAQSALSAKFAANITKPDITKVGRNDLCPCGSGKKFKKCCGNE